VVGALFFARQIWWQLLFVYVSLLFFRNSSYEFRGNDGVLSFKMESAQEKEQWLAGLKN
jgi:hypothetical protein